MTTAAIDRESLSAYGDARSTIEGEPLAPDELRRVDDDWRATLDLCLGMIYLKDNPLLREPLTLDHLKTRLLGHWGSDPGQSLVYVHVNRLVKKYDLDVLFVSGRAALERRPARGALTGPGRCLEIPRPGAAGPS